MILVRAVAGLVRLVADSLLLLVAASVVVVGLCVWAGRACSRR